jgi:rod shape-determining protein MreD
MIVLFVATLLEAGNLLNVFALGGWYIRPSILISLLLYYTVVSGPNEAISFGFIIGFATDLATGVMGPHTVCYGIMGICLNQIGKVLVARQAVFQAAAVFIVFIIAELVAYWLGILKTGESREHVFATLLCQGFYSAAICPLVWSILDILTGWTMADSSHQDWTHR